MQSITKRAIYLILTLLFLSPWCFAREEESLSESVTSLNNKIASFDKSDINLYKKIRKAWNTQCKKTPEGCFILESDVFVDGQKDRVLLFRGEPGLYSSPGTSPLLRTALKSDEFCGVNCNASSLISLALNVIQELLTFDVLDPSRMTVSDVAYLITERKWKLMIQKGSDVVYSELPPSTRLPEQAREAGKVVLNQQHIDGTFLPLIDAQGNVSKFDPYVSLTSSPLVAYDYAVKDRSPGMTSRVIVVSYPQKDLQLIQKSRCTSWPQEVGQIVNISRCSSSEEYPEEYEYDAALLLSPAAIRASLIFKL